MCIIIVNEVHLKVIEYLYMYTCNHVYMYTVDVGTIPCEFCGKNIPIPEFHDHQTECQLLDTNNSFRFKPDHDPVPVDDAIPCRTCKGLFPIDTIHSHEVCINTFTCTCVYKYSLSVQAACEIKYNRRPIMNGSTEATPTNQGNVVCDIKTYCVLQ